MEGLDGKWLKNISPDKTENRDAEYYLTWAGFKPGVCDCIYALVLMLG